MARPHKIGLEYSPQDTDVHSDRKIRRLLSEFGATGYLVYDYIKCQCYKENGYWLQYDDEFCFDVADFLKCGITENSVLEILKGCFRLSLFNAEVFKAFRIITSAGIQKRYLKVKSKAVIKSDLLVMEAETPDNNEETPEKPDLSTQSKEKEIKVNESKAAFQMQVQEFRGQYDENLLISFYRYWSECDRTGTKLRYQLEKTWELKLRLKTWYNNDLKFKNR